MLSLGGEAAASTEPDNKEAADISKGHVYEDIEEDWPPFIGKLSKLVRVYLFLYNLNR
jgi:hypothetical protein